MMWTDNKSIYDPKPDDFAPVMLCIDGKETMGYYWQYAKRFYCYRSRFDATKVSKWRELTNREWMIFQTWQQRRGKQLSITQTEIKFKAA